MTGVTRILGPVSSLDPDIAARLKRTDDGELTVYGRLHASWVAQQSR